jgi:ribonuclease P protein component
MLQKKHRLNKSKDIQDTSARGRSFFSPNFVIKFRPDPAMATRVAVVVSNYVSKKAVDRNRVKRLVREALRLNISKLKKGDYVIIVRPKAKIADDDIAKKGLLELLRSLKLLS